VTKADGGKFGKTESGAIWLTAERTSPYAYYQFWLNAADSDAVKFLKTFTLLPKERIDALEASHAADPSKREAQRELAREATALLHGATERDAAEAAAAALFSGDVASLSKKTLDEVMAEVPSSKHDKALLGAGMPLVDLLPLTTLAKSKREAKEFLANGSVTVNGKKAGAEDKVMTGDLLHGETIALRRGKKSWHVTRWG
jgi:tyrosyl-tRNA synthetase